jgi:hypothetical protein
MAGKILALADRVLAALAGDPESDGDIGEIW